VEELVLRKTGRAVSVVGLGTWQLGADWGEAAAQAGVTFLDTADVYGDGAASG
jgi:aryl-alcohol dehydrogenase-like predicted oxidoreductase